MTDNANSPQPKKAKNWMVVVINILVVLFFPAIYWLLFVHLLGMPLWLWFTTSIFMLIIFGISFYRRRQILKQQSQIEKIISENSKLLIKFDDAKIEDEIRKPFRTLKIFYMFGIFVYLFSGCVLYIPFIIQDINLGFDSSRLTIFAIITAILAAYSLWFTYRYPTILINRYKKNPSLTRRFSTGAVRLGVTISSVYGMRYGSIYAMVCYALMIGIFGGKWYMTLPFFVVSLVFYILYFPSKKKFKGTAQEIVKTLPSDDDQ